MMPLTHAMQLGGRGVMTVEFGTIQNPLPQRYMTDEPGIGGVIKVRPSDFLVEEIPLYQPQGEGEHLYLCIEKSGVAHAEMLSIVRRHFRVPERAIGFAGMKDKVGITRQTVSLHVHDDPQSIEIPDPRIRVLWAARHRNKLKRGHLLGNRFSIRMRDVDPLQAPRVKRMLDRLARTGVPNYYGYQRFGYRCNTHRLGALLLANRYDELLEELLGTRGSAFPEYQAERRRLFDEGRYDEAALQWTVADRSELLTCRALARGQSPEQAIRSIGPAPLGFWISALQSAIFNRVLDQRIADGSLMSLSLGDLAWKHDKGSVFVVTPEDMATDVLARRLAAFEISPSGPLWGPGMMRATDSVDVIEREALLASGLSPDDFEQSGRGLEGARRPLRAPITNIEIESGIDEHGPYIRTAFDLPRGVYATVALREIMKNEVDADDP